MEVLILIALAMVLVRVIGWKAYTRMHAQRANTIESSVPSSGSELPRPDPGTVAAALAGNPTPMGRCTIGLSGEPSKRR